MFDDEIFYIVFNTHDSLAAYKINKEGDVKNLRGEREYKNKHAGEHVNIFHVQKEYFYHFTFNSDSIVYVNKINNASIEHFEEIYLPNTISKGTFAVSGSKLLLHEIDIYADRNFTKTIHVIDIRTNVYIKRVRIPINFGYVDQMICLPSKIIIEYGIPPGSEEIPQKGSGNYALAVLSRHGA